MCGFVGVFHNHKNNEMEEVLKKMTDTIIHRGPDSCGYYIKDNVSIGFRRLSIIDLSSDGKQPMLNEDGTIVIAFNGEIYNYKELRAQLIEKGHRFKSKTDTEVLIHGYEEYGMRILDKVRGMFAFVLVDHVKNEYYLVRDFFGIKPLYYTQNTTDNSLVFGSEIKSFLEYPSFNKVFNSKALKP